MISATPLISVVMPVYNGEQFVRETIDSMLNQSCRDFEFIIVNDGSGDSTRQIVDSYSDPRIVPLHLPQNGGVCNARNRGTELAQGKYIAFCDADDLYDPNRLQAQLDFLTDNPATDVCGTYFIVFENEQEVLIAHPTTDREIKQQFFIGNCLGQPSMMGKAGIFKRFKYDPALVAAEDYELWARMATGGVTFANVPLPLVKYRLHPGQVSKKKSRLLHATSQQICARYTLDYLNSAAVSGHMEATRTSLADFRKFIEELALACEKKALDMNTVRPLIAQQYRKLDRFGLVAFMTLRRLSKKFGLAFPGKYMLNIFLLSVLPVKRGSSFFNTLTKLKS